MENLAVSTKKKFNMDDFYSQVRVVSGVGVKKILNASVKVSEGNVDCSNGSVSLAGRVYLNVVFVSEDDKVEKVETEYDFIEKQKCVIVLTGAWAKDSATAINVNFSGNEIVCDVLHKVCVYGVHKYELPAISGDDENLVLNKKTFSTQRVVASVEDSFVVAEEYETAFSETNVLESGAFVILGDVSCTVDKVVIEGKIVSNVTCADAENNVESVKREVEFKQEILAESVLPNMHAQAIVKIKNVTVTPEQKNDKTTLVYAFDLHAKCFVCEETIYDVAEDLFSISNEVQTTYDYLTIKNYTETKNFSDSLLNQIDISTIEGLDDFVGVFDVKVSDVVCQDISDKHSIAATISAWALYKTDTGIDKIDIMIPLRYDIIKENEDVVSDVFVTAELLSYKVKAGKELELSFNVNYKVQYEKETSETVLKSYEIKDAKASNDYAVQVYIVKEQQSVFEVAKVLNVKPEVIIAQNEVDDVFEKGSKIYVYSPANLF